MLFFVFAGDNYYPAGGWDDFKSVHTTEEEAHAAAEALRKTYDWAQYVDVVKELGIGVDNASSGA